MTLIIRPLEYMPDTTRLRRRKRERIKYAILHRAGWAHDDCAAEDLGSRLMPYWPKKRWPYHYVIQRDGTVVEILPLSVVGNHAARHLLSDYRRMNTESIGIAVDGDFRFEDPTVAQIDAARTLGRRLEIAFPGIEFLAHDEARRKPKHCPGHWGMPLVWALRGS